ncbi:dihydroorotate dehydrogenase electron transfer subunit [Ruminiclostridium sufflavum DSM 19573]|uniref:Dihydroorotate dehydrogenase electron transfer subunit n=1 Tax=Ruminiclostridium sufflavum DSM 19573 TaxID=1121337 RepID=A0A318XPR3_9FIRM|nr:dihydroorotate dehydrogenase electron transfer subunit [Ruminiclostridium sufflavum]PYG90311.1 dihydroorotate dehydrogenase electron transfer subunit [Ruminiclostridium sufflavum DSM 19573]
MGKIIWNRQLSKDFFLMKAEEKNNAEMGQFYMLRAWDKFPVLSRPISIFDRDEESVVFLYKAIGEGTERFTKLKEGDEITLEGPHGNTFPKIEGRIALVGGGVGIAPFYLTAKTLKEYNPGSVVDVYLGFSDTALLEKEYKEVADEVHINVGGYIIEDIDPNRYDYVLTCGPMIMMRLLYQKCKDTRAGIYVSMENRLACGVGACLVCTCKTSGGNKKVCKDGPVFPGEEVFGIE